MGADDLVQALTNGVLVAIGLYVVWRVWPRHAPRNPAPPALVAGAVSGAATLLVRLIV